MKLYFLIFSMIIAFFSQTINALSFPFPIPIMKLNGIFGKPFQISKREITISIPINSILQYDKNILKKINGFYGMIGPDVDVNKIASIYELFTGDGVIQGVFFDKGNITFVKKFIRTEKLLSEEKHGKIPNNFLITLLFIIGNKMNMMPNIIGLANTALMQINKKTFALFERDYPYLVNIDFVNKTIDTKEKIYIRDFDHFSAHSKFNIDRQSIDTIDYDIMGHYTDYYSLDASFKTINKTRISTSYMPFIHDFIVLNKSILITDSPLIFDTNVLRGNVKIPVKFDKNKPTNIHIFDKITNKINTYKTAEGFYIFHYAYFIESDDSIEMYASVYNNMDFQDLNIQGKYRKIVINKITKTTSIEKNDAFEKLNLEFPLKFDDKVVLLNIDNNRINGFVVCKGLKFEYAYFLKDKYICGEPSIVYIDKIPHLIAFAFTTAGPNPNSVSNPNTKKNGYLIIFNLKTRKNTKIALNADVNIGFHSIFVEN